MFKFRRVGCHLHPPLTRWDTGLVGIPVGGLLLVLKEYLIYWHIHFCTEKKLKYCRFHNKTVNFTIFLAYGGRGGKIPRGPFNFHDLFHVSFHILSWWKIAALHTWFQNCKLESTQLTYNCSLLSYEVSSTTCSLPCPEITQTLNP